MRMSRLLGLISKEVNTEPELLETVNLATWNQYRWVGGAASKAWRTTGDWYQHYGIPSDPALSGQSLVGYGADGSNSMRLEIPAIDLPKKAKRINVGFQYSCTSYNRCPFRWAICTEKNDAAYQDSADVPDSNIQLAHGTCTAPHTSSWNYIKDEDAKEGVTGINMPVSSVPSNSKFYIYLWAKSSAITNIHIKDIIKVEIYTK